MDNPTPVILTHSRPMTPAKTRSNAMNMAMAYARLTDHGPTKTVLGIANFVNVRKNMFLGETVTYIIVDGS